MVGFTPALLALGAALVCCPNNAWRLTANVGTSDLFFALSLALLLAERAYLRLPIFIPSKMGLSLILVVGCGLVTPFTHPYSQDFADNLLNLGKFAISAFVIPLTFYWQRIHSHRQLSFLALAYSAGAMIGVTATLARKHGISLPAPFVASVSHFGRVEGLTLHSNMVGLFSALAIPYLIYFVVTLRRTLLRLAFGLAILPVLDVVNLSGSRAALIASLFGLALMGWLATSRVARRTYVLLTFGVIAVLGAGIYLAIPSGDGYQLTAADRLFSDAPESDVSKSDAVRAGKLETALDQIIASPIYGNGYVDVLTSHDIYLELLVAGGVLTIVALSLYAWCGVEFYWRARQVTGLPWQVQFLMYTALAALAMWLVDGAKQNFLIERSPYVGLGMFLATARFIIGMRQRSAPQPLVQRAARSPGISAISAK